MPKYSSAIVIGASSGIGAELVRQLAQQGTRVAAVARRIDRLSALSTEFPNLVIPIQHDVTAFDEIPGLFQKLTGQLGGLDIMIYNAGVMPEVGFTEFDFTKDKYMVDVNLLGGIAWLNQAAIRFQGTKSGIILGVSSVAGDRGRAGQPVYNATKAAFTTYLEALRNRLSRYGVKVVTVKPGPVETEMTVHLKMKNMMSPQTAAQIILEKSSRDGEHYLKAFHWLAFLIIRNIPSGLFRKIKI